MHPTMDRDHLPDFIQQSQNVSTVEDARNIFDTDLPDGTERVALRSIETRATGDSMQTYDNPAPLFIGVPTPTVTTSSLHARSVGQDIVRYADNSGLNRYNLAPFQIQHYAYAETLPLSEIFHTSTGLWRAIDLLFDIGTNFQDDLDRAVSHISESPHLLECIFGTAVGHDDAVNRLQAVVDSYQNDIDE